MRERLTASCGQHPTEYGKPRAEWTPIISLNKGGSSSRHDLHMYPDTPDGSTHLVDLSDLLAAMSAELSCLLGPSIHLATGSLRAGPSAPVRAHEDDVVALLRHMALDAHDAMLGGGMLTIRTGRLREALEFAAIVLHEAPADIAIGEVEADAPLRT